MFWFPISVFPSWTVRARHIRRWAVQMSPAPEHRLNTIRFCSESQDENWLKSNRQNAPTKTLLLSIEGHVGKLTLARREFGAEGET